MVMLRTHNWRTAQYWKTPVFMATSAVFLLSGCQKVEEWLGTQQKEIKPLQHGSHTHDTIDSYYTCSMHPEIRSDKPGKCPICYMNLTKVEVEKSEDDAPVLSEQAPDQWQCKAYPDVVSEVADTCPLDGSPMVKVKVGPKPGDVIGKIKLKKSQLSHFAPEYFPVSTMKMTRKIRLLGSVSQSEEKESHIPARVPGRVEKVFVKSTGSLVRPGDPVLRIYSPKLITAGEEYILARKSVKSNPSPEFESLLRQSAKKLRLWGIPRPQYESWFRKDRVPRNITIYSNVRGIVRQRNATKGKYFKEGQNFFELSDLSTIWVEMDVYEHDSALVKIGQSVSLNFIALPGKKVQGLIDFVNPVLDAKSRTLKVRVTIDNQDGLLMPGMVAEATLHVDLPGTPLVVPRSAIIDTGTRKVAWVKIDAKRFQAKIVNTGIESEGYVEVLGGLTDGEFVVAEGSFLLDAQAQLFGGYEEPSDAQKTDPHANHRL